MKFGIVNKSTAVNRFVLHSLQRKITHLPVITRKTNIKLGIFEGGLERSQKIKFCSFCPDNLNQHCRHNEQTNNCEQIHLSYIVESRI